MMQHLLLAAALVLTAAADDPVVAERGADHITRSQARALIAGADEAARKKFAASPSGLADFLRDILLQRAILAQAQAEKWDQRADVAALVQRAHDQVVTGTFLAGHASIPAAYPAEADIQAAYEQNKARLMQPRSYHLAQLFLPKEKMAMPDQARAKLLPLRRDIVRGRIDLADAPKRVPELQYTDMGWVSETQLVPAVKISVSGTVQGALTDVVCIDNGCHLIRVVATRPAGPAPLADVRAALVQALRQQKQQQAEEAYAANLLKQTPIAINGIELAHLTAPH